MKWRTSPILAVTLARMVDLIGTYRRGLGRQELDAQYLRLYGDGTDRKEVFSRIFHGDYDI